MIIKKLLLAILLLTSALITACSPDSKDDAHDTGKKSIIAASFAEYDWVRHILGEKSDQFNLTMLIGEGADLHSYTPSVADIAKIAKADLLIHNGGVSDTWVGKVQQQAINKDLKTISLMQSLGIKSAAHAQAAHGAQCGATCSHTIPHEHSGHQCGSTCSHAIPHGQPGHQCSTDPEYDEHVWLSLRHAMIVCERLEDEISRLDPVHAAIYEKNKQLYIQSLKQLDERYAALFKEQKRDTVIIADRFPFRYLLKDYHIKHETAFEGCSADVNASFETIARLGERTKALDIKTILILEDGQRDLARSVIKQSGKQDVEIKTLSSIEAIDNRSASYLTHMEGNLKTLLHALSQ